MYIFNSVFSAKSKKTNEPFYQVKLFEKRESQDKKVYFKDLGLFVDKEVYDNIVEQNFCFGDIVEIEKGAPLYFGGPEQLKGLVLISESPYVD